MQTERGDKIQALSAVIDAEHCRRQAEHAVFMACTVARGRGVTWAEIGAAVESRDGPPAVRYGGAFSRV